VSKGRWGYWGWMVAFAVGQIAWVLGYWPIRPLQAALFTLLVFYVITGLTNVRLDGTFSRWVVIEYGVIFLLGAGIVWWLG